MPSVRFPCAGMKTRIKQTTRIFLLSTSRPNRNDRRRNDGDSSLVLRGYFRSLSPLTLYLRMGMDEKLFGEENANHARGEVAMVTFDLAGSS